MPTGKRETTLVKLVSQLDALDAKRRRIVGQIQSAAGALGAGATAGMMDGGGRIAGRRTMSAAARAKISAAQKARWAKYRKADK